MSSGSNYPFAGPCGENHRNSLSDPCYRLSKSPSLEPIPLSPLNAIVHSAPYTRIFSNPRLPTPGPAISVRSSSTSSNTLEDSLGQHKNAAASNSISHQLEQIIQTNDQLRAQVNDLLGNVIPKLLTTLAAVPLNCASDTFLDVLKELDETSYPLVTFWHHSQWKTAEKEEKDKERDDRGEKGPGRRALGLNVQFRYITDQNGDPVSGDRISAMGDYGRCLFHEFAVAELRLCFGNWKAERYAKATFAGWWQAHGKDYVDVPRTKVAKTEDDPVDAELLTLTTAVTSITIPTRPTSGSQVCGAKRARSDSVPSHGSASTSSQGTASSSGNSSEGVAPPPKKKPIHRASQRRLPNINLFSNKTIVSNMQASTSTSRIMDNALQLVGKDAAMASIETVPRVEGARVAYLPSISIANQVTLPSLPQRPRPVPLGNAVLQPKPSSPESSQQLGSAAGSPDSPSQSPSIPFQDAPSQPGSGASSTQWSRPATPTSFHNSPPQPLSTSSLQPSLPVEPVPFPNSPLQPESTSASKPSQPAEPGCNTFSNSPSQPESATFLDSPPQPEQASFLDSPPQPEQASFLDSPPPSQETASPPNLSSPRPTGGLVIASSTQPVESDVNAIITVSEPSSSTAEPNDMDMAPLPSPPRPGPSRMAKSNGKPYKIRRPILREIKNPNKVLKCGTSGTPTELCKAYYIEIHGQDATQGAFYQWLANIDQDLWESFVKKAKKAT
ncbi:hypothetical protein E1B28_010397 [Marasmius oreades]|uniref:Uncharacterized protein n=1 Tax=Marasmius oreades TaxID=181124 RepID=A0A9P7URQ8_9AGAR|nr:uncharacterized protein E1B28_010397 [Marasmius oreades]KAG7091355.1 hypothetical protein E1B28_010397 [Marasmius oreades]